MCTWDNNKELYSEGQRIKKELNHIGWDCDYDLSGEITDVWQMKNFVQPKTNSVEDILDSLMRGKMYEVFEYKYENNAPFYSISLFDERKIRDTKPKSIGICKCLGVCLYGDEYSHYYEGIFEDKEGNNYTITLSL